eukprot:gene14203-5213_t
MEKVRRENFFPPLVIPDAYKRKKVCSTLSKEGEKVKTELEQKKIFHEMFRKRFSQELGCGISTKQECYGKANAEDFCVACAQRVSLQSFKRPLKGGRKATSLPNDAMKGCICILCKRSLPLSPQGVGNHHMVVDRKTAEGTINKTQEAKLGRKEYMKIYEGDRDFQISSLHYDSRLEATNYKLEAEQYLPPREVMRRSERKCQLWLLKNEEHLKMEANRHRP